MSDFDEEARKRTAAIALLGDHGDDGFEPEAPSPHDGLMSVEEVFGEDDLDRADRAQRQAPDDSLAQKSVIRQGVWSDLHKIAPFARVNPPSVLQGTLGGQQQVTPGNNAQVAMWGGADAETLPVTVIFAPVQQVNTFFGAPGVNALRPYGIIQFGTRGFLTKAEVDIGRGCQFTVNASQVSLQVGLEGPAPGETPAPNTSMLLSGMLSFYTTTHRPPVTRTIARPFYPDSSTPSEIFFIPPFARGVMLLANTPTSGPAFPAFFQLVFYSSNQNQLGNYIYAGSVAGAPPWPTGFIPLPNDAVAMTVSYPAAFPTNLPLSLIFELAF